jgi:catechol 2,3-dioxygenase-like lactoylglutathione lyase family enzyme
MGVSFGEAIPALPAGSVRAGADFYRDRFGFEIVHFDEGFAVLRRDAAEVHLWGASDDSWRGGLDAERPVRSGAESFIAGTASCRIGVTGVDELYESCNAAGIVHPNAHLRDTEWGTREFGTLDPDGNLVTFFQR